MEPHQRLEKAMQDRRLELRMKWIDLAKTAGITYEALRSIRRGDYRPSELTTQALERALRWTTGSVEAVFNGKEPAPIDEPAEPERTLTPEEIAAMAEGLREVTAMAAGLRAETQELRETWSAMTEQLRKVLGDKAADQILNPDADESPEARKSPGKAS